MKKPESLTTLLRAQHPELVRAESRSDAARRTGTDVGALVERFRSFTRWRAQRRIHLAQHPLCVPCHSIGRVSAATVLDHVEPARDVVQRVLDAGGSEATAFDAFRDPSNLQGLCHTCDVEKSSRERSAWARTATERDE